MYSEPRPIPFMIRYLKAKEFSSRLDPSLSGAPRYDRIRNLANDWLTAYLLNRSADLERSVTRARAKITAKQSGSIFRTSAAELFYILLPFEPFISWQRDITTSTRLAKLTRLLETYTSMSLPEDQTRTRGWLATSMLSYTYPS